MNAKDPKAVAQEGIDLANVTFDANGEIAGLTDDVLEAVAGGRAALDDSTNNGCINSGC